MVKKVLLGTLFAGLLTVLVVGAVNRTVAKTDNDADTHVAQGQGRNADRSDMLAYGGRGQQGASTEARGQGQGQQSASTEARGQGQRRRDVSSETRGQGQQEQAQGNGNGPGAQQVRLAASPTPRPRITPGRAGGVWCKVSTPTR